MRSLAEFLASTASLASTVYPGPCIGGCGTTNFPASFGGPGVCGACDCGTPPELTKARRRIGVLSDENFRLTLALAVATGKTDGFTEQMLAAGRRELDALDR